jgi:N-acetylmuramoyl-L-alanine amidase
MFKSTEKKLKINCFLPTLLKNALLILGIVVIAGNGAFAKTGAHRKSLSKNSVYEAEKILAGLGYWISKVDDIKDSSTYHAIAAFQKVEGRKRTGVLTEVELEAMRRASRPAAAFSGPAHIEIDLRRQILFLVDASGAVTHILPVSTGNEKRYFDEGKWQIAHTPRGSFKITRQIKGTRRAPLGTLYHPNYFYGGVAIHGSDSIPFSPASHGCVRIPRFAAKAFSDLVRVGMPVMVFDAPTKL